MSKEKVEQFALFQKSMVYHKCQFHFAFLNAPLPICAYALHPYCSVRWPTTAAGTVTEVLSLSKKHQRPTLARVWSMSTVL